MGRRQVVRHRVLVPTFAGSIPAGPAKQEAELLGSDFCWVELGCTMHGWLGARLDGWIYWSFHNKIIL